VKRWRCGPVVAAHVAAAGRTVNVWEGCSGAWVEAAKGASRWCAGGVVVGKRPGNVRGGERAVRRHGKGQAGVRSV